MRIIFDCETFPSVFTLAAEGADSPFRWSFELSPWRDDSDALWEWLLWCREYDHELVGFNNIGFDYPVLHLFCKMQGRVGAPQLYAKAMEIIKSQDAEEKFAHMVYPKDRFVRQLDLFKIHHFDNRSKSTSLKALEFNMRMDNVADLPFPVGEILNQQQIGILRHYNAHDVTATKRFYEASKEMIQFREDLTLQYGRDFTNHNDTKIGAEIFQIALEKSGVECYEYGPTGRQPRQTKRASINLGECILPWIKFEEPEFQRVLDYLKQQVVVETKGVFTELIATVRGLDYVFGTGGLHASVENRHFVSSDERMIVDADVSSYYPNLSIANGFYPEHLGPVFCEIYKSLYEQRKRFRKGTAQNAALKLALNGSYGKSNDKFSIFYDPAFTMKITLNGQLLLCLLVEQLLKIPTLEIISCNTDGICLHLNRSDYPAMKSVCGWWQDLTKLTLEETRFSKLYVVDVNNYIGEQVDEDQQREAHPSTTGEA